MPQKCDLASRDAILLWKRAILAGRVWATIAGPPCSTWSAARFLELENGPRPTRLASQPWGIQGLSPKERRDLELASQLMRATIELLFVSCEAGAIFIFEHPAEATWQPQCASAWNLPEMQHAFVVLGVKRTLIDQC